MYCCTTFPATHVVILVAYSTKEPHAVWQRALNNKTTRDDRELIYTRNLLFTRINLKIY
jgi:hypothetical protein